jgi:hypothetical protein
METSEVQRKAESFLTALGVKKEEVPSHPFYIFITQWEGKSRRARWIYPLAYLVLGLVFLAVMYGFSGASKPDLWKLFGAVAAVFSALLAFYKPDVTLRQEDVKPHIPGNKLMHGADLKEFNRLLALPSKKAEDVFKLLGALASFFAVYVLLT